MLAGAVAGCGEKRHDFLADGRRQAVLVRLTQDYAVADVPLERPADSSEGEPAQCRRSDSRGSMEHFHQSLQVAARDRAMLLCTSH